MFNKFLQSEFKNKNISKYGFAVLGLIIIFLFSFRSPIDPDLFWHLKTGEFIWETKTIPAIDLYSHTMPDFQWIDHDWLSEVFIYGIYKNFGILGDCLFFSLIIIFIFAYLLPKAAIKKPTVETSILLGVLGTFVCWAPIGIRPQIMGWVGLSIILVILNELYKNEKTKKIFILPLLFLFWVNMHPSFGIGLIAIGAILAVEKLKISRLEKFGENEWVKKAKTLKNEAWEKLSVIFFLCVCATVINPYGIRIYSDFQRTLCDSYATNIIIEWLSLDFHSITGIVFALYLLIIIEIIALKKSRIDLTQFILLMGFLWLALQSGRHVPLFVVITIPFILESFGGTLEKILQEVLKTKMVFIGIALLSIVYLPQFPEIKDTIKTIKSPEYLARQGEYPYKAIEFLKENQQNGNMFNDYAWGGYIIWQYPEAKTFADGRMAHWKNDSTHIFKDYVEIITLEENWKDLIKKHNVGWMLIKKNSYLSKILTLDSEWEKVYQDDTAVILKIKE